jgi:hypothetical protein
MLRTWVLLDGFGIGENRGTHRIVAVDLAGRGEIELDDPFGGPRTGPVLDVGAPAAPVGRP